MSFLRLKQSITCYIFIILFSSSANGQDVEAPYDLEIIQPRAGLDVNNRFYKAYPGLVYEVRAAVIGGRYPYQYALETAPEGMTINAQTGEIIWPSPVAKSTAYPVSLTVKDSAGNSQKVSWSVLVTTDKFLFVDLANGKRGASGTINDPVQGFYDVYGGDSYDAKYATKLQGYFVYFKSGNYSLDGYTGGTQGVQYTNRQPLVWLAYPGHSPSIEMSKVALRIIDTRADNFYLDGFEIHNIDTSASNEYRMGVRIGGASSNVTFRNNKFHTITSTQGSYNQSAVMISRDASVQGRYWSFQDNEFYNISGAYGILGYSAQKVLIEDNRFSNFTGNSHPIGPKTSTSYWFIRHNTIVDVDNYGIWLYYNDENYGNMEVSYNYVSMSSGKALSVNESQNKGVPPSYIFRNTFVGDVEFSGVDGSVGPFYLSKNVIINSSVASGGYKCNNCSSSNRVIANDNLTGLLGLNIVNNVGNLTREYSSFLGKRGWQVSDISPPRAPSNPVIKKD